MACLSSGSPCHLGDANLYADSKFWRHLFTFKYLGLVTWQGLSRGAGARGPSPKAHSSLRNYGRISVSTCRPRSGPRQPERVLRHGVLSACGRWTSRPTCLLQVSCFAITTLLRRCNWTTLQDPQADPKPGGDADAVQWKEVASLSAMQSTLFQVFGCIALRDVPDIPIYFVLHCLQLLRRQGILGQLSIRMS